MKRKLKKEAAIAIAAAGVAVIAAGGVIAYRSIAGKQPESSPAPTPPVQVGTVLGGWQVNESYQSVVSGQEEEIFQQAVSQDSASSYEPVIVLADQEDDGMNYAVLSFRVQTEGDPESHFAIVTIHSGSGGEVQMLSSADVDPNSVKTIDAAADTEIAGTWHIIPSGGREMILPDGELQRICSEVLKDYGGKTLRPVAVIGKQTVSGKNWRMITRADNADGTAAVLYVTTIFVDTDGIESRAKPVQSGK